MTAPSSSRITLADLIPLIEDANLSSLQKRDCLSAVRTVARLLGADPADIAADPPSLRRRLDGVAPEAIGISRGRWNNVRSLFAKALALARPMLPGRSVQPIAPDWERLANGLPFNRRVGLRPLLRFLSAQGVGPNGVSLEVLHAYRDALITDRLRKNPEETWDGLVWSWNACRREVDGWPAVEIPRKMRREVYGLPWSAFPPTLKADVDAFLLRLSGADLSEDGPPRPARPATLKSREYQLRVAASALVLSGVEAASLSSVGDLVALDRFKTILRFQMDRHEGKSSPRIAQTAAFLKSVAKHWAKADDLILLQMQKIASRLSTGRQGLTPKNRERLRPFDDPATVARFLGLPEQIRRTIEKDPRPVKVKAVTAQSAAAIAILQAAPIRLGNLTRLDMRRNLIARGKRVYLVIGEKDTKNGEPVDFELPPSALDIVAWYVRTYRPCLVRAPTEALFPGAGSGPKSPEGLGKQIKTAVFRFSGLHVNPHLFRHAGAKIFLDQRPGQYEVVRQVLRHRSMETTTAFYAGAETRSAGQHFAAVIDELRSAAPKRPAAKDAPIGARKSKGSAI